MTFLGTVKNGEIVLKENAELPDGAEVRVELRDAVEDSSPPNGNQELWQAVRNLPESMTFEDVIDELFLLYKVDRGMRQLRAGQGIPHEDVRERFRQWLD